ncbi:MAG: hypothetical protein JWO89_2983 [Verrucomicrobiaceae bacterium]|nr:hypothetical protein [Verrucomicrobiaceae bacterium]
MKTLVHRFPPHRVSRSAFSGVRSGTLSAVLMAFTILLSLPLEAATTISDGNMVITLTDNSGAIYSAKYAGNEYFRLGVNTANWGLQVGTDTSTFRTNTIDNASGIAVTMAGTTATGTYTAGGSNVSVQRTYQAVSGHETLLISNVFVNNGATPVTLRYFDTFDPDQGSPLGGGSGSANDVLVVAGKTVAQASTGASPPLTCILGFNGITPVLSAGGPYDYSGIISGTILNNVFTNPADDNGVTSDTSINLVAQQTIAPGGTWSFEVLLAFGGSPAQAQSNFTVLSTAPVIAVEQPAGTSLTYSPASTVDFGSAVQFSGSTSKIFTIKNTGTGPLTSSAGISFGGVNAADFSVTSAPALPLAAGASTTFTVRFGPSGTGARAATLIIPSNDGAHSPFVVNLTGTGTSVTTLAATDVGETTATLNGSATGGATSMDVTFEYGLTTSYGSSTAATPATVTGNFPTPVSAGISSLVPVTTYHYRAKGVSSSGTATGVDMTFTTGGSMTSGTDSAVGSTAGGAAIGNWGSIRSGMVISSSGAVGFRGHLATVGAVNANNFQGIWKSPDGSSASLVLVARSGSAAPDTGSAPGVGEALFDILPDNPSINNLAQLSFVGMLRINSGTPAVTLSRDTGLWSELGGTGLHLVLREGDAITGGTVTNVAPTGWVASSDAGHCAFGVKLDTSSSALVRASISGATVTLGTLVKQGDAAPAVGGGTSGNFDSFIGNSTDPRMNAGGGVAFHSGLLPSGAGIFYQSLAGSLVAVARSGQATPGLADTFVAFERPSLSSSKIAFRAFLTTNGQSVWRGNTATPTAVTVLAKTNDTALPGIPAGSKLWTVSSPYSNSSGAVAFRVTMLDAGLVETRALVSDADGTLKVIAKFGDSAAGLAGETFVSFDHPVIGDSNQTAFIASTNTGKVGLWRQAPAGGALTLVQKIGDSVTTGNGPEVIAAMTLPGTATEDRLNEVRCVSSTGRILVHATYASGSSGMILTSY